MARSKGISGLGVAMVTVGLFLVYIGIKDVAVRPGLQALLSGTDPALVARQRITDATALGSAFNAIADTTLVNPSTAPDPSLKAPPRPKDVPGFQWWFDPKKRVWFKLPLAQFPKGGPNDFLGG